MNPFNMKSLTAVRNAVIPARKMDFQRSPKQAQTIALQGAYKFSRPKTAQDITQGRINATDVSRLPKGTTFR